MAVALGINPDEIDISGARAAGADASGRRRAQATAVEFDFVINSADPAAALAELGAQLSDPSSALLSSPTTSAINPAVLAVAFICPVGLHRPAGATDCLACGGTSIVNPEDGTQCIECPARMAPDPKTAKTSCVCADGFYNTSLSSIRCYEDGERFDPIMPTPTDVCMPCDGLECVACHLDPSLGSIVLVAPGFSLSNTKLLQRATMVSVVGQRAIYPCPGGEETCPNTGGIFECILGSAPPLCSTCATDWSRPGLAGNCKECSDAVSILWAVGGAAVAITFATAVLYFVSGVSTSAGGKLAEKLTVLVTLGKIAISL